MQFEFFQDSRMIRTSHPEIGRRGVTSLCRDESARTGVVTARRQTVGINVRSHVGSWEELFSLPEDFLSQRPAQPQDEGQQIRGLTVDTVK